ncbi:MAG: type II secretion system GspH family protein [Firmicutes bacterium]|nr:type II secretion system GspH family protein [Bacillota bacterium]
MKMKKDKGFTLIEVIITMLIASVMCFAIAAFLFSGYNQFERVLEQKRKVDQVRLFRARVTLQFKKLTNDNFFFSDGPVLPNEVKFSKWKARVSQGLSSGGRMYAGTSEWAGLVYRSVAFYTVNIDTTTAEPVYRRHEYSFNDRQVRYAEWDIKEVNSGTGMLPPIEQTPPNPPRVTQVILNDVNDMQITSSMIGIPSYDIYPPGTIMYHTYEDAENVMYNNITPCIVDWNTGVFTPASRVENAIIKIYVDMSNSYVAYSSCMTFANRNKFLGGNMNGMGIYGGLGGLMTVISLAGAMDGSIGQSYAVSITPLDDSMIF